MNNRKSAEIHIPDVIVRIGGMSLGTINIPIGTRLTPNAKWGKSRIWKDQGPNLIHADIDNNNGSIIIIDQDTVEIAGEQHKLVHPLKLNMSNIYCIWINGNPDLT